MTEPGRDSVLDLIESMPHALIDRDVYAVLGCADLVVEDGLALVAQPSTTVNGIDADCSLCHFVDEKKVS